MKYRRLRTNLLTQNKDQMKLFQKAGKIKIWLSEKNMTLVLMITIPPEYPLNKLKLSIIKGKEGTKVEKGLLQVFEDHMQELVRRYHQGYDGLESDINEGKIGENSKMEEMPLMSYEEMQHDIEFLREQADLREVLDNKHFRKKYRQRLRREARKELDKAEEEEKRIKLLQDQNKMAKP